MPDIESSTPDIIDDSAEIEAESQFNASMFTNAVAALEYYKPDPIDTPIDQEDYFQYTEAVDVTTITEYSDRMLMLLDYDVLHDRVELLKWSMLQFVKYNCTRNHICWSLFDNAVDMLTEADLYHAVFDEMIDTIINARNNNIFRTLNTVSLLYTQRTSLSVIAKYDTVVDELLNNIISLVGYGENMYLNMITIRMLTELDFPSVRKAIEEHDESSKCGTIKSELANLKKSRITVTSDE